MKDDELRLLLVEDTRRGWRAFIDQYTPTLLALIHRAGITERDEAMDVYVRACERLAADDCARLRRHDPSKGPLRSWLAAVVRHAAVDWIRSRAGRRRLFGAIRELGAFDRRVFELFYWEGLLPTDIAALLAASEPDLPAVFDSLSRIEAQLTLRHRAELMSLAARRQSAVSLDAAPEEPELPIPAREIDPETRTRIVELQRRLDAALRRLPAEDAAIVRLRFCEGLGLRDVQRALHLPPLSDRKVADILARLRSMIALSSAGATEGRT
jgi:DNA-directed RNA polymerase specialized sigma24 family protein